MKNYITTTRGMSGYFAVMFWWDPEPGFWEPYQVGIGCYETRKGAIEEAKQWAKAENLEYKE